MTYVYLWGVCVYVTLWVIFFLVRRDLRKKIFFSSMLAMPLGISEMLFIPDYWIPRFQTISISKELFLESFPFCFFFGGVTSVIYQFFFRKKLFKTREVNPFISLIAPILFSTYFLKIFAMNVIYYACLSMLTSACATLFLLNGIRKDVLSSAFMNTVVYFIFFLVFWHVFPELPASYQLKNLIGIQILGVPVEEICWAFSFSLYWTPLYEVWSNYLKSPRSSARKS